MISNVFTKTEILEDLASKGCYIDAFTLDSYFKKNRIEAVFEDDDGNEMYDKNAYNAVMKDLYNNNDSAEAKSSSAPSLSEVENGYQDIDPEINIEDALDLINDISLSDGTMLVNKLEDFENIKVNDNSKGSNPLDSFEQSAKQPQPQQFQQQPQQQYQQPQQQYQQQQQFQPQQQNFNAPMNNPQPNSYNPDNNFSDFNSSGMGNNQYGDLSSYDDQFNTDDMSSSGDFDDMSLLSESFEAQEKLRQYVISELSKNNLDVNPQQQQKNTSPDVSEKAMNTIARTMAKKIAKYVGSIMSQDMQQASKAQSKYEVENRRLIQKLKELDEQNRKLKLLLAETNKNLNSYKPGPFGFYVKVDSKKNKK